MNFKTTIILVSIALAFLCYIYFFEKESPGTLDKKKMEQKVFAIDSSTSITRMDIVNQYGAFSFARGQQRDWLIERPVSYRASRPVMEALLSEVVFARRQATLDKSRIIDYEKALEDYGLKPSNIKIKIVHDEQFYELSIGKSTPREGAYYAMIASQKKEELIVISKTILDRIDKELDQWRSRKIFALDIPTVEALTLRDEGQELSVVYEMGEWRVVKPLAIAADSLKVQEYLSALNAAQVQSFLSQEKGQAVAAGLTTAKLSLEIKDNNEKLSTLWVGNALPELQDHFYAKLEGEDLVFTVTSQFVETIKGLLSKVRDKHVLLIDEFEEIVELKLENKSGLVVDLKRYEKEEAKGSFYWQIENLGQSANGVEVRALLDSIKELQALEFYEPGLPEGMEAEMFLSVRSMKQDKVQERVIQFGQEKDLLVRTWNTSMPYAVSVGADFVDALSSKRSWDFLNTTVIQSDVSVLNSLAWNILGESTKIVRDGLEWKCEDYQVDQNMAEKIVDILAYLSAERWVGQINDENFVSGTTLSIGFAEGKGVTLRIGNELPDGTFLCSIKGDPFTFSISGDVKTVLETVPLVK